jgi:hypothetical protein
MNKSIKTTKTWTDNVSITPEATNQYVIALLHEYDNKIENGEKPNINPYTDKLTMKLIDGGSIEIPETIKKNVIINWNIIKKHSKKSYLHHMFEVIFCLVFVFILLFLLSKLRKVVEFMNKK